MQSNHHGLRCFGALVHFLIALEGSAGEVDVVAVTEGQESMSVSFTVFENAAPVIEELTVDQTRLDIGRTLTLSWQVSDADSAGLTCEIDWGNGLSTQSVRDCNAVTETTYMYGRAGTYTIELAVLTTGTKVANRCQG